MRLVRGLGTVSVVGAHFEPDFPLDNGLMFEKEMTLRVSWGHAFDDRERLLAMLAAGMIDPRPTVTHRFALAEAEEAYRVFDAREAVKVRAHGVAAMRGRLDHRHPVETASDGDRRRRTAQSAPPAMAPSTIAGRAHQSASSSGERSASPPQWPPRS